MDAAKLTGTRVEMERSDELLILLSGLLFTLLLVVVARTVVDGSELSIVVARICCTRLCQQKQIPFGSTISQTGTWRYVFLCSVQF